MKALEMRPDDWVEQAPIRCSAERAIEAPAASVWEQLADHGSWPQWFPGVRSVTVTGAASGVGAERRVELSGVTFDEEFVVWDPFERFAFSVVGSTRGFLESLNERVILASPGPGRCVLTYTQAFAPKPWLRPAFPMLLRGFRRNLRGALDALAARVE